MIDPMNTLEEDLRRLTQAGSGFPVSPEAAEPESVDVAPLEAYTLAALAVEAFEREHLNVLAHMDALLRGRAAAEAALKGHCRDHGPTENAQFAVLVQHKTAHLWDTAKLLAEAPYLRSLPGLVTEQVNTKEVERIAKGNAVLADAIARSGCVTEQPLTPAITIRRKGETGL